MAPRRRVSNASTDTTAAATAAATREQELSNMYDYLAKIILLGPSGCGKSCLLHRFVNNEWRVLSSQTVGVEFASKIIKVGTGARRKRIKLQLWDTAGTERFRSVTRSYYRGSAGLILIYDVTNYDSFRALPTFLSDARALASPHLTVLLAGNKLDLAQNSGQAAAQEQQEQEHNPIYNITARPASSTSDPSGYISSSLSSTIQPRSFTSGGKASATVASDGREVGTEEAAAWAVQHGISQATEISALTSEGIEELFSRLAGTILTRIELGEIDPSDPHCGIQYGDVWNASGAAGGYSDDASSMLSATRSGKRSRTNSLWPSGMRDWEEVFRLNGGGGRRRRSRGCSC